MVDAPTEDNIEAAAQECAEDFWMTVAERFQPGMSRYSVSDEAAGPIYDQMVQSIHAYLVEIGLLPKG